MIIASWYMNLRLWHSIIHITVAVILNRKSPVRHRRNLHWYQRYR